MANKTRYIPLLLFLLALFSCTSREERELSALLDRADSLMRTRPDSALAILTPTQPPRGEASSSVPSSGKEASSDVPAFGKENPSSVPAFGGGVRGGGCLPYFGKEGPGVVAKSLRMRYALLRADALNKCDSVLPSDTLLREVADYYDRHGSANERMRAHYLLGRCYHDMGEAPRALECYHHAAEQADTTRKDCDFYTLSTCHYQTAELFRRQGLFALEIEQLEKSIQASLSGHDTLCAIDHYYYKGIARLQNKDTLQAINIIKHAADNFRDLGHKDYAAQCLSGTILPLIERKKFSEARQAIDEYEAYSGYFHDGDISPGREIFYYSKGMYYVGIHQYDSALSCFKKELHTGIDFNNQLAAAHGLSIAYKEIGNADSTAKYAMIAYALNDSAYSIEAAQHIVQSQSMYNYGRIQQIANQKEKTNNSLRLMLLGSLFSVLTIMLIAYLLYSDIKKKRSENERMRKDLEESKNSLKETRHELSLLKKMTTLSDRSDLQNEQLRNVIKEKETYIARLRSRISYYQSRLEPKSILKQDSWLTDSSVISLFHNYAKHSKLTPSDNEWQELFTYIDTHLPDFYAILSSNGTLKVAQYKLCYLLRAGLSNSEITTLLADEISNTTMTCKNLHKKILSKDGKASDFKDFLVNIHT